MILKYVITPLTLLSFSACCVLGTKIVMQQHTDHIILNQLEKNHEDYLDAHNITHKNQDEILKELKKINAQFTGINAKDAGNKATTQ